ncbi:hypothetical protein ACIB24_08865 [Spongisporangium articulatum]|uniref:Mannosyltransferase n=1 Tax=Spongisporangium articulatum TaxID=3362603 RepID=A0ABW8ALE3_9ACTN
MPTVSAVRSGRAAAAVTAAGALVYGWQVGRPGVWMDEAATIDVCRRTPAQVFALARHEDLVHLAYYLVAKLAWAVHPSIVSVRSVGVAAMAATAGLLVLIGARLRSLPVGVVAGLLLVVNPLASRFAQEARSAALVTVLATLLTWQLLGLLERTDGGRRWAGYSATLVLLGLANVLGLLMVLPHALAAGAAGRLRAWTAAAAAGLVVLAPFVLAAHGQRGQVYWIPAPHLYDLHAFARDFLGGQAAIVLVGLLVVVAALVRSRVGWTAPVRRALRLGLGWALLPPAVLWTVSFVTPLYQDRYVLYVLPGIALALAALVVRLATALAELPWARWLVPAVALALVAVVGAPAQAQARRMADGHTENLAAVADYLARSARPGDEMVAVPMEVRMLRQAYPQLAGLADPTVAVEPLAGATLEGKDVPPGQVPAALAPHPRIWLVRESYQADDLLTGSERAALAALAASYRPGSRRVFADIEVTLMVRRGG